MTFLRLHRGDITIHGINGGEEFGLRWPRLIFPDEGMPSVQLGPLSPVNSGPTADPADANATPLVYGHAEPTLSIPIDENSAASGDPVSDGRGAVAVAGPNGMPAPDVEDESATGDLTLSWHAPYFPSLQSDLHAVPAPPPGDNVPPAGFIPKSDAIIWSGPAIMAFPPDAHDASGNAPAPDTAAAPDAAAADVPDAVTRADLDPVLIAMGSGADHTASAESGGGDLSGAFLPPGSSDLADLPHGLDLGFGLTPPPMPPPPDIIG